MVSIEQIHHAHIDGGDGHIATIIYASRPGPLPSGVNFLTNTLDPLQLACMTRPRGEVVPAHTHKPNPRKTRQTQEVLILRTGKLRITFYGTDRTYAEERILNGGDVVILLRGGHKLEILEEVEMIEVKNGPYLGRAADKEEYQGDY